VLETRSKAQNDPYDNSGLPLKLHNDSSKFPFRTRIFNFSHYTFLDVYSSQGEFRSKVVPGHVGCISAEYMIPNFLEHFDIVPVRDNRKSEVNRFRHRK
jgi:hypothetical protein